MIFVLLPAEATLPAAVDLSSKGLATRAGFLQKLEV
jgi:hypothetical protein